MIHGARVVQVCARLLGVFQRRRFRLGTYWAPIACSLQVLACSGTSTISTPPGGTTTCTTEAGALDCRNHDFFVTAPDNTMTQCNMISDQCPPGWTCTIETPQGFVDGVCQ